MKRNFTTFIVLILTLQLFAGPVSKEQAQTLARNFMAKRGVEMSETHNEAYRAKRKTAAKGDAYYYVFNAGNDRGYVIVSGDDRTEEILGYSDRGTFDLSQAPDNMKAWLQGYADYIKHMDDNNVVVDKSRRAAAADGTQKAKHAIKPLLTCKWNQGDPYNLLCPVYYNDDGTEGDLSATGCVATAIAQVMYHYRWPDATKTNIPRHTFTSGGGKQITMKSVPRGTKIDWENMTDTYSQASTEEQKNAVAELMVLVGQGVKMGYGPSSGAGFSEGVKALRNYFGYDDGTHVEFRGNYTIGEWTDLLYDEIANNHPVAFAGTASGGAHAFVIDGYDGDGLFHLNWGWGGGSDGYFRVEILNPGDNSGMGASSSSDGYSMGQEAIILRLPDDVDADNATMMTINDTRIDGDEIFSNYINWSGSANTFDYGVGYIAEDGSLVPIGDTRRADNLGANYYHSASFPVEGLDEGTWRVVPISKLASSDVWKTSFNVKKKYIIAKVSADGNYTLEMYETPVDLKVESIDFTGNKVKGNEQKLDVVFRNNTEEFYGEIYLFASKTGYKGGQASRSAVSLKKGHTTTTTFFFKPTEAGTYNIWLTYDGDGNRVVPGGETQVVIAETPSAETVNLSVSSVLFDNISGGTIYGNFIRGRVKVTNNSTEYFDGYVKVGLWKAEIGVNSFWGSGSVLVPMVIEPGRQAEGEFVFNNLELDKQYGFNFAYTSGGELSGGGLGRVNKLLRGMVTYYKDGNVKASAPRTPFTIPTNVVAVDLRGITAVAKVNNSRSPEALFFFDEGAVLPEGVEESKAVVGGRAGEITLGSAGFYAPADFTAEKITYSREVKRAGGGVSWETIALPFSPETLTADGLPVGINDGKGVWMREFSNVAGDYTVGFDNVSCMETGVPYIYSVADESLVGKNLVFSASDVSVAATPDARIIAGTDSYTYHGTTLSATNSGMYVLNAAGTAFTLIGSSTTVDPYSAYFTTKLPEELRAEEIPIEAITNGIDGVTEGVADGAVGVYTLGGVKVGTARVADGKLTLPALPKGVYVVAGRKVVL